jgi:hypothetical protein
MTYLPKDPDLAELRRRVDEHDRLIAKHDREIADLRRRFDRLEALRDSTVAVPFDLDDAARVPARHFDTGALAAALADVRAEDGA